MNNGVSMYFPAIVLDRLHMSLWRSFKTFYTCKVNLWASCFGASSYNPSQASNVKVPISEKLKIYIYITVLKLLKGSAVAL